MPEGNLTNVIVVIIVVIIILWWWNGSSSESFVNENIILPDNPLVPQISGPTQYDPQTGTMMTSPDFIPQHIEPAWSEKQSTDYQAPDLSKVYSMDTATNLGKDTMAFNMCSKSCCSKQYPVPFEMPVNPEVAANMKDFVPSRFTCNNYWEDAGCLCITGKQSDNLANRGGNV